MCGDILGCHIWREVMPLASREQRLGILLNILQYTAQPPVTKNYLSQNVESAKVEQLCFKVTEAELRIER